MCCYKKIIKHITITREIWVKVPPPKLHHHHHMADDDAVEMPPPGPHAHHQPPVVQMGEVFQSGGACRKAVPVRDGNTTVIVLVNVHCR